MVLLRPSKALDLTRWIAELSNHRVDELGMVSTPIRFDRRQQQRSLSLAAEMPLNMRPPRVSWSDSLWEIDDASCNDRRWICRPGVGRMFLGFRTPRDLRR